MKKALELLKEIEWERLGKYCRFCGRACIHGHLKHCELGQAIALLEAKPEPGELVKEVQDTASAYIHYSDAKGLLAGHIVQLCDEIEQLEKEAFDLSVAKTNAENECCVLRGEVERLEGELARIRPVSNDNEK